MGQTWLLISPFDIEPGLFSIQSPLIFYVSSSSFMEKAEFLLQIWPGDGCTVTKPCWAVGFPCPPAYRGQEMGPAGEPWDRPGGQLGVMLNSLCCSGGDRWGARLCTGGSCIRVLSFVQAPKQGAGCLPAWGVWQASCSAALLLSRSCFGERRSCDAVFLSHFSVAGDRALRAKYVPPCSSRPFSTPR